MTDDPALDPLNPYHARVLRFINSNGEPSDELSADNAHRLLINLGEDDGIEASERVIIFALGEEINDLDTGEALGKFEVVRGEGRVESVQAKMAIVKSSRKTNHQRRKAMGALFAAASGAQPEYETVTVDAPFRQPQIGDFVRFI